MADSVVEIDKITDETKKKLRDFDEEEAYFLLCEIFSYAQASKDYAKFQSDLNEWKKRYPIDLFSDALKAKIKYMLSKEFLDTILKGFIAFDELSKKDPATGLEKLRKILASAEKHKDAKRLDKDLNSLYDEYPLSFLKEKYPHVVSQLLSKSNRTKILEKFDSSLAFKELTNIVENPNQYKDSEDFKASISEWQKLYNTSDFNNQFRPQVEQTLKEALDDKKIEELFPVASELDLTQGEVIPIEFHDALQNISKVNKDALYDFFKIVDKNKNDVNGLFNWMCQYSKYINSFDLNTKNAIVTSLMGTYRNEMPPINTHYMIPAMESKPDEFLSLEDYTSIDQTKKDALIQLLGILSTGKEFTDEDSYQLNIINENVQKAKIITKAKIDSKLDLFIEKFPEELLTPYDSIYLNPQPDDKEVIDIQIEEESKEVIKPTRNVTTDSASSDGGSGGFSLGVSFEESKTSSFLVENPSKNEDTNKDSKGFTPTQYIITDDETIPTKNIIEIADDETTPIQNVIEDEDLQIIPEVSQEEEPYKNEFKPIINTGFEMERDDMF